MRVKTARNSMENWSGEIARLALEGEHEKKSYKATFIKLLNAEDFSFLTKIALAELGIVAAPVIIPTNLLLSGISVLLELEKDINPRLSYLSKMGGGKLVVEAIKGECLACKLYVELNGRDRLAARRAAEAEFTEPIFSGHEKQTISQKSKYFYLAVLQGPFEAKLKEKAVRFLMNILLNELDTIKNSSKLTKEFECLFAAIYSCKDIAQRLKDEIFSDIDQIGALEGLTGKIQLANLIGGMGEALEETLQKSRLIDVDKLPPIGPLPPWR